MFTSMVGRMMCNEFKRDHMGRMLFDKILSKYPSIIFVGTLILVPLVSLIMVFAFTAIIMYPIAVFAGWI